MKAAAAAGTALQSPGDKSGGRKRICGGDYTCSPPRDTACRQRETLASSLQAPQVCARAPGGRGSSRAARAHSPGGTGGPGSCFCASLFLAFSLWEDRGAARVSLQRRAVHLDILLLGRCSFLPCRGELAAGVTRRGRLLTRGGWRVAFFFVAGGESFVGLGDKIFTLGSLVAR